MKKKVVYSVSFLYAIASFFIGCKKEIDFDYNEVSPIIVVEGIVTNEGMSVTITDSRSMLDSIKRKCLQGADVRIVSDKQAEHLVYDAVSDCYRSVKKGEAGLTYRLTIDYEGHHYEAASTMMESAPIRSAEFLWQPVLNERLLAYEMWAVDPEPDVRNYYWYRMDRHSSHPHLSKFSKTEAYRWNVFDDRGCPPGLIYRDIMCMSERAADEDEEENWKNILYEGDTITLQLVTIDQAAFEFFTSLRTGQSGGANPRSNITGGCLGYFYAGSVTHADTIVFSRDGIRTAD